MSDQPNAEQLIDRWRHLETVRQSAVEEQDAIKAQLRVMFPVGKHETPAGTITLSLNRRFDPTLAEQHLASNPDLLAACSVTKVDSSKAKKILPPAVYEACSKVTGDPAVRIS